MFKSYGLPVICFKKRIGHKHQKLKYKVLKQLVQITQTYFDTRGLPEVPSICPNDPYNITPFACCNLSLESLDNPDDISEIQFVNVLYKMAKVPILPHLTGVALLNLLKPAWTGQHYGLCKFLHTILMQHCSTPLHYYLVKNILTCLYRAIGNCEEISLSIITLALSCVPIFFCPCLYDSEFPTSLTDAALFLIMHSQIILRNRTQCPRLCSNVPNLMEKEEILAQSSIVQRQINRVNLDKPIAAHIQYHPPALDNGDFKFATM